MQDFGFADLRVVNAFASPFDAAQLEARSAVSAGKVMRAARRYDELAEAIADCGLVAGTTAIGGRQLHRPVIALREAAPLLVDAIQAGESVGGPSRSGDGEGPRVALLFGSEKTGLSNEQLSYCALLLTIPMFAPAGRHLSMNLGQAAAVCLYELTRAGFEGSRPIPAELVSPATVEDRQRLLSLLLETMQVSGYARRFPANARPEVVRQLVLGLSETGETAATWMGVLKLALRRMHAGEKPS